VLHVSPQERLESEGEAVPINTAIVLQSVCTSSLLAATAEAYGNDFQIEHHDTELAVKTYSAISKGVMGRRDHEFEGAQNHFVLVAEKKSE
jgi:hypothetical protein